MSYVAFECKDLIFIFYAFNLQSQEVFPADLWLVWQTNAAIDKIKIVFTINEGETIQIVGELLKTRRFFCRDLLKV